MSKLSEARSDKIEWGGGGIFMPHSGIITLSTAQANTAPFVAPCAGKIIVAEANLIVTPGTAGAVLQIGKYGSAVFYGAHTFALGAATGRIDVLASFTNTTVAKGEVIVFGTDGAATSTGLAAITIIINPFDL